MSLLLDEHRLYLSDRARLDALERAIREVVKPGLTVLDLGCGTGILGLMACRAGASKVYAIDEGGMIEVAREVARANNYSDRIVHIRAHSSRVELPEKVDVVVSDQIGRFGFEAGLLTFSADARRRFLKPGGVQIPLRLDMHLAPVECAELHTNVEFWGQRPAGFDFAPAVSIARNTGYPFKYAASHILGPAPVALSIDVRADAPNPLRLSAALTAQRKGTLHGIGGWFTAQLSASVRMTNAPGEPDAIRRMNVFFPIERPVPVVEGQRIDVTMTILQQDHLVNWKVGIPGVGDFSGTTLRGMLVPAEDLLHTRTDFRPRLNPWGEARATVVSLCDGRRTVGEIEQEVQRRHANLFTNPGAAATFVAEVVTRYSV